MGVAVTQPLLLIFIIYAPLLWLSSLLVEGGVSLELWAPFAPCFSEFVGCTCLFAGGHGSINMS